MRGEEQSRLSLGSYGWPRMTEVLKEIGLDVGHRPVGRLMRQNGIYVVRTRKHKVTTIGRLAIAKQSAERGIVIKSTTLRPTNWIGTSRWINQMPHSTYRSWVAILFTRLPMHHALASLQGIDERKR